MQAEQRLAEKICESLINETFYSTPGIQRCAKQLSKVTVQMRNYLNDIDVDPEALSSFMQKCYLEKEKIIFKYYEQTGKEIWTLLEEVFNILFKNQFPEKCLPISQPILQLTNQRDLNTFCKDLIGFIEKTNCPPFKKIMQTETKTSQTMTIFQELCKMIDHFPCLGNQNDVLTEGLIQIKKRQKSAGHNLESQEIAYLINFLSILFSKKIQIEILQKWMKISQSFLHNTAANFFPAVFTYFSLVKEIYNCKWDRQFPESRKPKIGFRGRIPYFQPVYGKRYGFNVDKIYENDDWLGKINKKNQWAVAFYGLHDSFKQNSSSVRLSDVALLKSLLLRNSGKKTFKENPHAFQKASITLNQEIGNQIYCSPLFFHQLFNETEELHFNNQTFRAILQCRVRPESIKCLQNGQRWMVTNPRNFRPYAIILFTPQETMCIRQCVRQMRKVYSNQIKRCYFQSISLHPQDWQKQYQKYEAQCNRSVNQHLNQIIEQTILGGKILKISLKSNHLTDKLRVQGAKQFSKLQMPIVKKINLQNNQIKDEGVQALCTNTSFKSLETIELNDNAISTTGVSYIINNKWSKQVNYKLDTVKTKDDGYAFQIGKSISTIKSIIRDKDNLNFYSIEKASAKNYSYLMRSLDLLMNVPLQGKPEQIMVQSKRIEQKHIEQVQKNQQCFNPTLSHVLLALKNVYKQSCEVVFTQKSNVKTQVSTHFILCGANQKRVRYKHRLTHTPWMFHQFQNNNSQLLKFQSWYKQYLVETFGAKKQDIILHKINKGSLVVQLSHDANKQLIKKSQYTEKQDIQVKPFFDSFHISQDDFDHRGDYTFPEHNQTQLQYRAGLPYFQPVYGTRFGLKVRDLYDNGNQDWLSMDGNSKQWAIAFHGITYPSKKPQYGYLKKTFLSIIGRFKPALQSIMSGRKSGKMLKQGHRNRYQGKQAVNTKTIIKEGIYTSPLFSTALDYAGECKGADEKFFFPLYVVLQCRIDPNNFFVCPKSQEDESLLQDYWVIHQSQHIRPYGIVLFTQKQKQIIKQLAQSKSLYQIECYWKNFKGQFEEFRNQIQFENKRKEEEKKKKQEQEKAKAKAAKCSLI